MPLCYHYLVLVCSLLCLISMFFAERSSGSCDTFYAIFVTADCGDPTAQLYKSRGVFMKKGEKFTIEDGMYVCLSEQCVCACDVCDCQLVNTLLL